MKYLAKALVISSVVFGVTWLCTLFIVRKELPVWAMNEAIIMPAILWSYERRIKLLESESKLTREIQQFREAIGPMLNCGR